MFNPITFDVGIFDISILDFSIFDDSFNDVIAASHLFLSKQSTKTLL